MCAEAAYGRYVAAIGQKPAPMVADFAGQIDRGMVSVVIDETAAIVGFIVFYPQGDNMFLENVAIRPESAGRGIGRALIQYCEAEACRLGLSKVRLYTNEKMVENLSLYPRLGYAEMERRTEEGFRRVYFEKAL